MTNKNHEDSDFNLVKTIWPFYVLTGFFSMSFSGIFILIVPLSFLFWPGEPFHAFEMGLLITSMLWVTSVSGVFFGKFIDNHNFKRTYILFIVALARGFSFIMLSFANEGRGMETWWYFFFFIMIFAFFAGGNYTSVISLSNDIIPKTHRSRFFGIYSVSRHSFQLVGFVIAGYLVQIGFWRLVFSGMGLAILISGVIMVFKIKEPKRGAQHKELLDVLKKDSVKYDFQIDREMMKKTMLSKTNLVALIEGIFTSVFLGSLIIIILPYMQTEPHNFSPFATGVFLAIFGLSGGVIGQVILARFSDKVSQENHTRRLYFIIVALSYGAFAFVIMFFLPLPYLTVEQGKDIALLFSFPVIWLFGCIYLSSRAISSLYEINQPPVLQDINLPEAQGQITSWNRLLETIAFGSGPLIAGILISITGYDYQLVAILIGVIAIPGILLWVLALKYFEEDHQNISKILSERAQILNSRNSG